MGVDGNIVPRSCRAPAAHGGRGSCCDGGGGAAMRMSGGDGGSASAARRSAATDRSASPHGDTQHELQVAAHIVGVWRSPPSAGAAADHRPPNHQFRHHPSFPNPVPAYFFLFGFFFFYLIKVKCLLPWWWTEKIENRQQKREQLQEEREKCVGLRG